MEVFFVLRPMNLLICSLTFTIILFICMFLPFPLPFMYIIRIYKEVYFSFPSFHFVFEWVRFPGCFFQIGELHLKPSGP